MNDDKNSKRNKRLKLILVCLYFCFLSIDNNYCPYNQVLAES